MNVDYTFYPDAACFLCDREGGEGGAGGNLLDPSGCTSCPKAPGLSKGPQRLAHSAMHILSDTTISRGSMPCGFCLRPGRCTVYLMKGKGSNGAVKIDMENLRCPLLHNIYIAAAAEYSRSNPCTNHPLQCPECSPLAPAVWKYNFEQHLIDMHEGINRTQYEKLYTITEEEKFELGARWEKLHSPKKRSKKPKRSTLAISDGHTARLALR